MQVEVDMKCTETKLGGHGLSSFKDFAPFLLRPLTFNDRTKADFDEHIAVTDDWDEFCSSLDKKMVKFCS